MSPSAAHETDDPTLLADCIAGDRKALDTFVTRFSPVVWFHVNSTLRRMRGRVDEQRAADLYQQVFVALLDDDRRRLRAWRPDGGASVATWIRVITIRTCLTALRRERLTLSLDDDGRPLPMVDDGPDPFEQLLHKEGEARHAQLFVLAEKLSNSDRLLLEMIFRRHMPAKAIAAALQIKPSQVYVRKNRMIRRLRGHAEAAGLVEAG